MTPNSTTPAEEAARSRASLARAAHARSESAYVFVRTNPNADASRCFERLFVADGVCYCDAVAGEWDIVLLLQAGDRDQIEELARAHLATGDIEAFEVHHAERPWLGEDLESFLRQYDRMQVLEEAAATPGARRDGELVAAYTVVDLDTSYLVAMYAQLYFDDNVVCCDVTDGCRTAVLFVQACTVVEMERALSRIRAGPGVRGSRTLPIVTRLDASADVHRPWRVATP